MAFDLNPDKLKVIGDNNPAFKEAARKFKERAETLGQDAKLLCYSYLKQASEGDCNLPKPGMLDLKAGFQYAAWMKVKGTSQADAIARAISEINKHLP